MLRLEMDGLLLECGSGMEDFIISVSCFCIDQSKE